MSQIKRMSVDGSHECRCGNKCLELIAELEASRKDADALAEALEDIRDISFDGDGLLAAKDLGKDIAGICSEALSAHEALKGKS